VDQLQSLKLLENSLPLQAHGYCERDQATQEALQPMRQLRRGVTYHYHGVEPRNAEEHQKAGKKGIPGGPRAGKKGTPGGLESRREEVTL
jgi:hypothetical protein